MEYSLVLKFLIFQVRKERIMKMLKSLSLFVIRVTSIVLMVVMLMGVADRFYGSPVLAHAIEGVEKTETQEFITEAFEQNHEAVNKIGAAARSYVPWNHQDAAIYEASNYVVMPDLAERTTNNNNEIMN
jgi:hypothetical protein